MMNQIHVTITGIGQKDAYFPYRDRLVGQRGVLMGFDCKVGWYNGFFKYDKPVFIKPGLLDDVGMKYAFFSFIKVKGIKR